MPDYARAFFYVSSGIAALVLTAWVVLPPINQEDCFLRIAAKAQTQNGVILIRRACEERFSEQTTHNHFDEFGYEITPPQKRYRFVDDPNQPK